jgi:hypothetical protein
MYCESTPYFCPFRSIVQSRGLRPSCSCAAITASRYASNAARTDAVRLCEALFGSCTADLHVEARIRKLRLDARGETRGPPPVPVPCREVTPGATVGAGSEATSWNRARRDSGGGLTFGIERSRLRLLAGAARGPHARGSTLT